LNRRIQRRHLIPPLVEPVQPPRKNRPKIRPWVKGEPGPLEPVGAGQAGGAGHRNYLEKGLTQGLPGACVVADGQKREANKKGAQDDDQGINPGLGILEQATPVAPGGPVVKGEIQTAEEHEDGEEHFQARVAVVTDGQVPRGETAGGHGAEAVAEGLEPGQAQSLGQRDQDDGQTQIDDPEDLGGLGYAGTEPGLPQGTFVAEKVQPADPQKGEHGQHQHYDPHPA